jgi:prepilin-type N-terminal cleavage/methylation domain-containing protein
MAMRAEARGDQGFTLIELLVVICIIAILVGLSAVGATVVLGNSRVSSTEALLQELSSAVVAYQLKWGDFPPTALEDIGGRSPNATNSGIETLVACLSSKKRGGPLFQKDDHLSNVDSDSASTNLTDWYFGTNELFEYTDFFGNPIIYYHHRDFEKTRPGLARYKFSAESEEVPVSPELHPTTKAPTNAGRFQLRSVGRDGKPGTPDDLRPGN